MHQYNIRVAPKPKPKDCECCMLVCETMIHPKESDPHVVQGHDSLPRFSRLPPPGKLSILWRFSRQLPLHTPCSQHHQFPGWCIASFCCYDSVIRCLSIMHEAVDCLIHVELTYEVLSFHQHSHQMFLNIMTATWNTLYILLCRQEPNGIKICYYEITPTYISSARLNSSYMNISPKHQISHIIKLCFNETLQRTCAMTETILLRVNNMNEPDPINHLCACLKQYLQKSWLLQQQQQHLNLLKHTEILKQGHLKRVTTVNKYADI